MRMEYDPEPLSRLKKCGTVILYNGIMSLGSKILFVVIILDDNLIHTAAFFGEM